MASKLTSNVLVKNATRTFAAQAAAAQKSSGPGALQVEKAKAGVTVVSIDRNEPVSRIGVFLRAGARYTSIPGLSSAFQHCASGGMSTPLRTGLNLVRTTEQLGATKCVSVGREVTSYSMAACRDCVDEVLSILSSITSNNNYQFYEFPTQNEIVRFKAQMNVSPLAKALDLAVKAAFRSQSLGNSIYCPDYNINNLSTYQVNDFVSDTHGTQGIVLVGSGVDHEVLYGSASAIGLQDGRVASAAEATKYLGGDIRVETGGSTATVVVLGEGAKYGSAEALAAQVAAKVLGSSAGGVSFSSGAESALVRALKGAQGSVEGQSFSFSDAGLLGFSVQTSADSAPKAVSSLVSALKNLSASDKDVSAAKASLIGDILQSGYGCSEVESIGTQMLLTGNYVDVNDSVRAVEGVTSAAVNKAISKAFSGKLTVASVGNINNVPYADTL